MAITIIQLKPTKEQDSLDDSDSEEGGVGLDTEDFSEGILVTPGQEITSDPQWMRGHGTYVPPGTTCITSSVAGTISRTNKLLSARPLRARYTPEIGDTVVGRITEVQSRRWRVDVNSSQPAVLQLSAINLPGGILRRRTETDELQIRTFFAEGDLLVAEVQQLHHHGDNAAAAALHTRSLRYGKLRDGLFLALAGVGGGGGVVRGKRQIWTIETRAGPVDVVCGVNGYLWICRHVPDASGATTTGEDEADAAGGGKGAPVETLGLNRVEETVSWEAYSNRNNELSVPLRREITRVRCVIMALAENGVRVDEESVRNGFKVAMDMSSLDEEDLLYLGGERGRKLARQVRSEN